jgi:methionine--tRNA ligase beta chain
MPEKISIDDFAKVEMRVGQIVSAEPIEGSEKLLKLKVNFGSEERQVLSGIAKYKTPEELVGKKFAFATNLQPRQMMGLESQAMILAVGGADEGPFAILEAPDAEPGARVH